MNEQRSVKTVPSQFPKAASKARPRKVDIELPGARSRWLRPSGWFTGLAAVLLTSVFTVVSVELDRGDPTAWQSTAPDAGYYWAVAQYQVEFMRLRLELNMATAGHVGAKAPVFAEDIKERSRALGALARGLRAPGTAGDRHAKGTAFAEAAEGMVAFQRKLDASLAKPDFGRQDAMMALIELESMESTLTTLVGKVAEEERARREATLAGLKARRSLLWSIMVGTWCITVLWLVSVTLAARKHRLTEQAKLRALDAERHAVTEREAAIQQERQAVREKEAAVQQKARFLTSISHELRSALQSICSALDVLEQDPGSAKDGVLVGRIKRATDALIAQLQDLLTLARGEAGKLELHPGAFEACELVQNAASEFATFAARRGLKLAVELPPAPIHVIADYTRITQILVNLISNAVKYTERGEVTVTVKPYDRAHERLFIAVKDTGPGIPANSINSIFERYERLGIVDRTSDSAGVGLAIVQTVAKLLGANITVSSREGQGTEFLVDIPATPKPAPDEAQVRDEGSKHVLIVDDRPEVLEGLVDVAKHLGVVADTAGSAALAANRMTAKKYDLVLIDLDMPDKGGRELASETRQGRGVNRDSRLIAFSAADGRAVANGWPFDGFVQKPIDRHVLGRLIEGTMPGSTRPSTAPGAASA